MDEVDIIQEQMANTSKSGKNPKKITKEMLESKRAVIEIKNTLVSLLVDLHMMWKESLNLKTQEQEQQKNKKQKEQKLRRKIEYSNI